MTYDSELDDLDEAADESDVRIKTLPADASDKAIEKFYESGRLRVIQDKNDLFLPHVLDFIEGRRWGNLQPEYQRRLRWDNTKKSKLIESFIMNVPVPPVFLYENELGRYEVMDGQQRLNAVVDFLKNRFSLTGLKIWPALNGRTFDDLPPIIRRGLEKAKVSAITLMSDSGDASGNSLDLRAQVFERLNTGGERLNPQELRNSLYSGPFNKLIIELSRAPQFTEAWSIPSHDEHTLSDGSPSDALKKNLFFKRMTDVEIALRFFAFKDPKKISGSVRSMLDETMKENRNANDKDLAVLRDEFLSALDLCVTVFGAAAFKIPYGKEFRVSRPFFDAQMVAMHQLSSNRDTIVCAAELVKSSVLELARPNSQSYDLIVGRANTAVAVRGRISAVEKAILQAIS